MRGVSDGYEDLAALRDEMRTGFAEMRREFAAFRQEVGQEFVAFRGALGRALTRPGVLLSFCVYIENNDDSY